MNSKMKKNMSLCILVYLIILTYKEESKEDLLKETNRQNLYNQIQFKQ